MKFRPCIDIHNGSVKQIVGGSLKDEGDLAQENFVSVQDAAFFSNLYREYGLCGGHIILLNPASSSYYEETKRQALSALSAYPGGLQVGGRKRTAISFPKTIFPICPLNGGKFKHRISPKCPVRINNCSKFGTCVIDPNQDIPRPKVRMDKMRLFDFVKLRFRLSKQQANITMLPFIKNGRRNSYFFPLI